MATIRMDQLIQEANPVVDKTVLEIAEPNDPFDGLGDFDIPLESVKGWAAARELLSIACGYEAMRRKLFTLLNQPLGKKKIKDLKLMIETAQEELVRVYRL
ncbi:MAG: hypothetical protein ABI690_13390 [Chloroflexota bacterium]